MKSRVFIESSNCYRETPNVKKTLSILKNISYKPSSTFFIYPETDGFRIDIELATFDDEDPHLSQLTKFVGSEIFIPFRVINSFRSKDSLYNFLIKTLIDCISELETSERKRWFNINEGT